MPGPETQNQTTLSLAKLLENSINSGDFSPVRDFVIENLPGRLLRTKQNVKELFGRHNIHLNDQQISFLEKHKVILTFSQSEINFIKRGLIPSNVSNIFLKYLGSGEWVPLTFADIESDMKGQQRVEEKVNETPSLFWGTASQNDSGPLGISLEFRSNTFFPYFFLHPGCHAVQVLSHGGIKQIFYIDFLGKAGTQTFYSPQRIINDQICGYKVQNFIGTKLPAKQHYVSIQNSGNQMTGQSITGQISQSRFLSRTIDVRALYHRSYEGSVHEHSFAQEKSFIPSNTPKNNPGSRGTGYVFAGAPIIAYALTYYVTQALGASHRDAEGMAVISTSGTTAAIIWAKTLNDVGLPAYSTISLTSRAVVSTEVVPILEVAGPVIAITVMCGFIALNHTYEYHQWLLASSCGETYVPKDYLGKDNFLFADLQKHTKKALFPLFENNKQYPEVSTIISSKNKKSKDITPQYQDLMIIGTKK